MNARTELAACFHCGLPLAQGTPAATVLIDGTAQSMCCPGCQAVAQAIVDIGQTEYYRTRSAFAATADAAALVPPELALYDNDSTQFAADGPGREATLAVDGIRCAACVWLIEKRLARLPGVQAASLNVATERLFVRWDPDHCQPSDIMKAVRAVGYAAYPYDAARHGEQLRRASRTLGRQLFVAGLSMMQVMMYAVPAYMADDGTLDAPMAALLRWASLLLTVPAVAYSALPFFKGAWSSIRARAPGMDLPVALGIGAAFGASVLATFSGRGEVYFDSVTMFVFLLLCSRYLELGARRKAAVALERLQHALPAAATRMPGYPATRVADTVAAAALAPGDIILVKPGEALAADGIVVEGESALDLSLLTGESAPRRHGVGDAVHGGAINVSAALVLRVTRAARESTLSDLIRLAERAGQSRPRIALWADKVASTFVVALLLLAAVVFVAWQLADPVRAWPIAIAVLVVSCPCALSLATPTVLAAATDALLRQGVLVVRAHALETLHRATHVVFDKTGTLTAGEPVLQAIELAPGEDLAASLDVAAALEAASAHPLARAIHDARTPGARPPRQALALHEVPGQGVEGVIGGLCYRIGNAGFVRELAGGEPCDRPHPGASAVYLGSRGRWLARFLLADPLRDDARALVDQLQQAGKTVIMLSGDEQAITDQVAAALGIEEAHGARLPDQKLRFVRDLQSGGAVVAMVGDGINDAAVLGAADVSFAMGSGAALAQVHADAVLLSGQLAGLALGARVAAKSMRVIRQNLAWASIYNAVAIPAAALGFINPWISGVGMTLSSALVVANALRLRTS